MQIVNCWFRFDHKVITSGSRRDGLAAWDTSYIGDRWLAHRLPGSPEAKAERDCVTFSRHGEKNLKSGE